MAIFTEGWDHPLKSPHPTIMENNDFSHQIFAECMSMIHVEENLIHKEMEEKSFSYTVQYFNIRLNTLPQPTIFTAVLLFSVFVLMFDIYNTVEGDKGLP